MNNQDLCLPFFCNNCHHLVFILKRRHTEQPEVLEYADSGWKRHLCYRVKGPAIWDHQKGLAETAWGSREIPFRYYSRAKKSKASHPTLGIVIKLPESSEESQIQPFIKVLTIEGSLIDVRTVGPHLLLSAGILIDLRQAEKVGQDKYRLKDIQTVSIDPITEQEEKPGSEHFKLSLASFDQEQLEVFIERFLEDLSSHNLFPVSIIPLPLVNQTRQTQYGRQIAIPPSSSLQKTIETMTIPKSIKLSLN